MKIAIGISGGVDSAVAALLLKQEGHDLFGLFMKNWEEDDDEEHCAAATDLKYAKMVCSQLEIPLHTVNFSNEYWDQIFEVFLQEYRRARTPNPDVLCNKEIKFKLFAEHARTLGADKIATGHYAGIEYINGEWHLLKGQDSHKDQSYFLYLLEEEMLSNALFPLAKMNKKEVRKIAKSKGLTNYNRKDSTGICFIGERRFSDFLSRYIDNQPGDIVDESGTILGTHSGIWFYTIGQRTGLGIGGVRDRPEDAWYVADKDFKENRVIIVQGHHHPALFTSSLVADSLHWINGSRFSSKVLTAKIRHRQPDQKCCLNEVDTDCVRVNFEQPQRAVAMGQSVVFYDHQHCLGGGIITSETPNALQ